MIVINYTKKNHNKIIHACVHALTQGKVIAYPTDTSYGLACDITSRKALAKLYRIKERNLNKPIHIVLPSADYGKKIAKWNTQATKLARRFLPGALTLILPLKSKSGVLFKLGARTGTIGLRLPKNSIALDLAKKLKKPITATGANPSAAISGGHDSYTAKEVCAQFQDKKYKPDIVLDAGRLPKRKPSTLVKINGDHIEILRVGPISEKQISIALKQKINNEKSA